MSRDLEQMIASFQKTSPTPEQLLKWSLAAQQAKLQRKTWLQVAVSVAVGIVLGLVVARSYWMPQENSPLVEFNATYSVVTVKNL